MRLLIVPLSRLPKLATLGLLLAGLPLTAQVASLTLSGPQGAMLTFEPTETGWRWTRVTAPNGPDGIAVVDNGIAVATATDTDTLTSDWLLRDQTPDQITFDQESAVTGLKFRRVFSFGLAPNVVRIETWVRSLDNDKTLKRAGLLEAEFAGESFHETGGAPASFPLFGQNLFVGIEHVSGEAHADDYRVHLSQAPNLAVSADWRPVATVVVGWPLPSAHSLFQGEWRMRDAFLTYLDTVRVKPRDLELHTNTWWTLPLPFSEADVLKDIEALRQGFTERTGMFFDSYALDLGWSNPHSIWQIDPKRFPNGLRTINERLASLGAKLGLWVSPGSAYPEGLDNNWLKSAGYETTPIGNPADKLNAIACFALGGRYQTEFKNNLVAYASEYALGHVKFDFMAHTCDVPTHGHPTGMDSYYTIDAALADVLDSLRAVNPRIVLEPLVCGMPPSPWWNMKTPYLLGPHGDDVPFGRVACPEWIESLITARDIAYRGGQEKWLMPTQALETFDIVKQTPGDFENLAAMAIGRGRWFISTYLRPEYMQPQHWDFLAGLVRWARANKQYLGNAWMFGGTPAKREAYGYLFHNADKDIYCVRNPWIETTAIELPTCDCMTAPRDLRIIFPRRSTLARLEPGADRPRVVLGPYETLLLESTPAGDTTMLSVEDDRPVATVDGADPSGTVSEWDDDISHYVSFDYAWGGTVSVPDVNSAELCVLVEGSPIVNDAYCQVVINGRIAKLRRVGSEGQFGAAAEPSPDHWTWFTVPVSAGDAHVQVTVQVPDSSAAVGIYLRGQISAPNEPAPDDAPAIPAFHPGLRNWSQTVTPLKEFSVTPPDGPSPGTP